MTQSQEIVKLFAQKLNLKFTKPIYTRQIGIANSLLNTFTYEELVKIIEYLGKYGYKKPITSIAFIPYVANEILQDIKVKEQRKKVNNNNIPQINIDNKVNVDLVNVDLVSENKRKAMENNFANRGLVSF